MTTIQTISFKMPPPKCSTGMPLAEGSDVPAMRPRTGARGSDREMIKLLESAMESLAGSVCSFWACRGPRKPVHMCTCSKCWAMREIGTVLATLKARFDPPTIGIVEPPFVPYAPSDKSPDEIAREIVSDLREAISLLEPSGPALKEIPCSRDPTTSTASAPTGSITPSSSPRG